MKTLKIALIICLSSLSISCSTFSKITLPKPSPPVLKNVNFQEHNNGYYLTKQDALILADNIEKMKIYIEKLEFLLKTISNEYGVKFKSYERN